jgi:small-conductance mechanosensitive channel
MEFIEQLQAMKIGQNTGYDYFLTIVIFVGLAVILKIFQAIILARLHKLALKTKTELDDILIEIFKKIKPPFYFFISIYFSIKILVLPSFFMKTLFVLFVIIVVYEVIKAVERLVDYFLRKYLEKNQKDPEANPHSDAMIKVMQMIIRTILWLIGITLVLSNLGVNVSSLIAGLGIGGIAIALALQNVLSDLFSAFTIYVDKPFKIGDHIKIGTDRGEVENVGLKSTRIRTVQGEQLIVSNQELTNTRIHNFRRMEVRRANFSIGVTYDTPAEKLEAIMIKNIVDRTENVDFARCHFVEYADSSLNFQIVMDIKSKEFGAYLDVRQAVNMAIFKKFAEQKIEFAYPTQTIFVNK